MCAAPRVLRMHTGGGQGITNIDWPNSSGTILPAGNNVAGGGCPHFQYGPGEIGEYR